MTRTLAAAVALLALAGPAGAVAFPQADANHDGFVTYEEAVQVFPLLKPVQFRKCDPNGDGRITKGEYPLLNTFYWMTYVQR